MVKNWTETLTVCLMRLLQFSGDIAKVGQIGFISLGPPLKASIVALQTFQTSKRWQPQEIKMQPLHPSNNTRSTHTLHTLQRTLSNVEVSQLGKRYEPMREYILTDSRIRTSFGQPTQPPRFFSEARNEENHHCEAKIPHLQAWGFGLFETLDECGIVLCFFHLITRCSFDKAVCLPIILSCFFRKERNKAIPVSIYNC